jgi:hypothetical protein
MEACCRLIVIKELQYGSIGAYDGVDKVSNMTDCMV